MLPHSYGNNPHEENTTAMHLRNPHKDFMASNQRSMDLNSVIQPHSWNHALNHSADRLANRSTYLPEKIQWEQFM